MTVKLIGTDDGGAYHGGGAYQLVCRFQAVATGNMTQFKIKGYGNSTISYAVYADNAGSPAARLAQQATPQATVEGWNTLAISSILLIKNTWYWLAFYIASGEIYYDASGGVRKHKADASTFPDPFDNTGFVDTTILQMLAGWGLYLTITGQVTLSGSGVSGATVRLIKQSTNTCIATTTTDVNGNYSFSTTELDSAADYHVVVEYTNGGIKYNALSLWNLQPL